MRMGENGAVIVYRENTKVIVVCGHLQRSGLLCFVDTCTPHARDVHSPAHHRESIVICVIDDDDREHIITKFNTL